MCFLPTLLILNGFMVVMMELRSGQYRMPDPDVKRATDMSKDCAYLAEWASPCDL